MNQSYLSSAEHRTRVILDAYGSKSDAWPDDERQATLECIARSPILQHYRAQLETLDQQIAAAQSDALASNANIMKLQQRILSSLPAQTSTAAINNSSLHKSEENVWFRRRRLAVALASVLLLVLLLSQHLTPPTHRTRVPASASFAAWSWYDITGQDLPSKQPSSTLSMTDLIDMEINQDGG